MADVTTKRREDVPQINVGFGQSRPVEPAAPRQPSMGVRLLRGDFQAKRPPAAPSGPINVGWGGAVAGAPDFGNVTSSSATKPRLTMAQPAPAAAPAAATAPRPDFGNVAAGAPSQPRLTPGTLNTFTGSDGVTRRVDPAPPASAAAPAQQPALRAPAPVVAAPSTAPQVQEATARAASGIAGNTLNTRGRITSALLNPMGNDAELLRRLENSQRSAAGRGSPQARRLLAQPYLEALGLAGKADLTGLEDGNRMLQQGAGYESAAMEGAARRQTDVATFNADDSFRRDALAAEQARPSGATVRGTDGRTSVLRNDGTAMTLRDEAGNPIVTPETDRGALTPAALLESYSAQAQAINEGLGTPEEKAMQQATLRADPLYSSLFRQQQPQQIPVGTERGGYRYTGGDPANQASWQRIN